MTWLASNYNSNNNFPLSGGGGGSERLDNNNCNANADNEAVPQVTADNSSGNPANASESSTVSQSQQSDHAIDDVGGRLFFDNNYNNMNAAVMNFKAQQPQPSQFGQQLVGGGVHSSTQAASAAFGSSLPGSLGQWNNNNNNTAATSTILAAQVTAQANLISQLVASLQAQQQQAQVQVALARAFGPGINNSNASNGMNSMQAAAAIGNSGYCASMSGSSIVAQGAASSEHHQGTQGFSTNSNSMMIDSMVGGVGSLLRKHQQEQGAQQQQLAAAQLVHQMHHHQQQQQLSNSPFIANSFGGDATAASAMTFHPNNYAMYVASAGMPAPQASSSSSAGAAAVLSSATADEIIKLRFEHEQHTRMLQIVHNHQQEADRQDPRALLSNQVAAAQHLMKKAQWDIDNSGASPVAGVPDAQAFMNGTFKTIFQHQQQPTPAEGNTTSFAAAFPPGNHHNLFANVAGLHPTQHYTAAANLSSVAGLNHYYHHQGLENAHNHHLINAVGIPALAGLGMNSMVAGGGKGGRGVAAAATDTSNLQSKFGASSYGVTIVPCRARGMPVDHNLKTAYFFIPENSEHGDELMCAYPSCRNAGVKFRYCLHCKVPVAKRNFRNRHRHGVMEDCSDEEDASEEEEVDKTCKVEVGTTATDIHGEICHPVGNNIGSAAGGDNNDDDDDDDYTGVKKEHILIIPGIDNANNLSSSDPMNNKKKKNGKLRVPCRARGLPLAHNFKSAYFIIPPNIEHGDELLCSFPLCRNAGAKFRYCLHCKVPVAKRNFRNRHKHGKGTPSPTVPSGKTKNAYEHEDMQVDGKDAKAEIRDDDCENHHAEEEDGEKPPASMESSSGDDVEFSQILANVKGITDVSSSTESTALSSERSMDDDNNNNNNNRTEVVVDSASRGTVSSSHDVTKVQKWVEMLENKPGPEDEQAMAIWMANLMNATIDHGGGGGISEAAVAAASMDSVAPTTQSTSL